MNFSLKNNSELANALEKGNKEAFKFIFEALYDDMVCYILSLCNDRDKAEDIVQETFVKLWEQHRSLTINTSVKNYLLRTCHNRLINSLRGNKKTISLSDMLYLEDFLEEDNTVNDSSKDPELFFKAIETLPPKCREIFVRHKLDGQKYKAIADDLNISVKTVENQMTKAYRKLRDILYPGDDQKQE
ncbi:RNA polymerase sigma-70 factor, ECF subfamily [Sinomicrobium oceani]|uniref:RNA polymerase sigma-70 factor, ECF subfamily n=1 Tax=Sinomicrobium oceani TaxID=1150368 RepID=A0A1K1M845_9FLAO|nr:RNA polymerase sigma-70 factor, ECF subfamily [Sinomicrobium oceani]